MSGNGIRTLLRAAPLAVVMSCGFALSACDTGPGELAKCDSQDAKDLVQKAIEENPNSPTVSIKVLDISDIKETSYDDKKPQRVCTATIDLNAGQISAQYTLRYSSDKTKLLVSVQRLDDDNGGDNSNGDGQ